MVVLGIHAMVAQAGCLGSGDLVLEGGDPSIPETTEILAGEEAETPGMPHRARPVTIDVLGPDRLCRILDDRKPTSRSDLGDQTDQM